MKPAYKSSSLASEENDNLAKALEVGSLCALGGGLPLPVKNALKYFEGKLGGILGRGEGCLVQKLS